MGIKFYCPQGHKLNVKSFLAGKKGVCPHCGTKVRIPLESQRGGAHDDQARDDESPEPEESDISSESPLPATPPAAQVQPSGTPSPVLAATPGTPKPASPAPVAAVPLGAARPVAPIAGPIVSAVPTSSSTGVPVIPVGSSATAVPVAGAPHVGTAQAGTPPTPGPGVMVPVGAHGVAPVGAPLGSLAGAAAIDPFLEAPNAEWYVCPPTGGRYGPATGDILKRWIGEGRVTSDSLVWRSGWGDWKPAATVLAMWGVPGPGGRLGGGPPPAPTSAVVGTLAGGAASSSAGASSAASYAARRRTNSSLGVVIVILLGILSIALLVALVWVIKTKT